ncbi:MAG: LPS-assembly protein LptD [Alistipes sp.]|nr:LPS-assembly protein LptD [Alistipes sp.]
MNKKSIKYLFAAAVAALFAEMIFARPAPYAQVQRDVPQSALQADSAEMQLSRSERRERERAERRAERRREAVDRMPQAERDSAVAEALSESIAAKRDSVSAAADSTAFARDSSRRGRRGSSLGASIAFKASDSLSYNVLKRTAQLYKDGDVTYQNMNLKSDYMNLDMNSNEIYAYGKTDTVGGEKKVTRPVFEDASASYTMDTITYNINSGKAKIKGVATQEGDGWLVGGQVKKMPDNTVNISDGKYTTCDRTDHPHFYLAMTKAKMIPGKKVVTGAAYIVLEDVPLYPLMIPGGFFPLSMGPKSGLLMPTYGEEHAKGFFMRDFGYYFTIGQHMDLALRGGFYTLGSWEAKASSRYVKRYKYSGSFNAEYSSIRTGEKGMPDFINQSNFRLQWTHSQDPKANPGSTFSASVNFATSGYSKYSATTLNDILSTQTNSSIAYSRNWQGTPFSLSANMSISQNSQNATIAVTLPNIVFNVSRIYPFKRRERMGKEKWYEKISMQYTAKMTNSVSTKESEIFSKETLKNMKNGVEHTLPVSASFNLFNYINVTPSFNYTEKWHFKRQYREWNPVTNSVDYLDPEYGFYRLYNYNMNVSASTIIYGMYDFTKKRKDRKLQAIRHTITPTVSFSYAPDFSRLSYGYYKVVQSDSTGRFTTYSPYSDNAYGVPSSGRSMSLNFSLSQNLEMKVMSKRDTTGVKKVKLIDEFRISGSYNFLADSMNLSNIALSFRTTLFKNFGIQLSATLDPYEVSPQGVRYNKLMIKRGLPGRIINTGWSFGYTFKSREDRSTPAINDINSIPPEYMNPFYDPYGQLDPVLRRQYMSQAYYDFSLPWNFGFNYTVNYSVQYINNGTTGFRRNVTQTVGFNGSVNITPKMGLTFQGGFDVQQKKLTTSAISISRDLHCWQMSFSWIPFGYHRSWSFHIGVKAASLSDLKYDKSQSMYDNLY